MIYSKYKYKYKYKCNEICNNNHRTCKTLDLYDLPLMCACPSVSVPLCPNVPVSSLCAKDIWTKYCLLAVLQAACEASKGGHHVRVVCVQLMARVDDHLDHHPVCRLVAFTVYHAVLYTVCSQLMPTVAITVTGIGVVTGTDVKV